MQFNAKKGESPFCLNEIMTNNQKSAGKVVTDRVITGWSTVVYAVLTAIGLGITALFAIWWFNPAHVPQNFSHSGLHIFDFVLFALLTYVVWYQIVNEVFSW